MDADTVCNEFHLRMTMATTEHERFLRMLATLVPTPDTVVSPATLEAITDARNILVEVIASVCEAYGQLDDVDGDIDPDEEKVMDEACNYVREWHEEIEQLMVQLRQMVWDNQHGYIRRLISGAHSRAERRSKASAVDIEEPVAPVVSIREEVPEQIDVVVAGDDGDSDTQASDDAGDDQETEEAQENEDEQGADGEDPSEDVPENIPEEPAENPVESVAETPKQPVPVVINPDVMEKIRAEVRSEVEAEIRARLEAEQAAKAEETKNALLEEGYKMGVQDLKEELVKGLAAQQAAVTADQVAAESTPMVPKAKPAKKPAKKTSKTRKILPGRKKEVGE